MTRDVTTVKRMVIKIGSSVLTDDAGRFHVQHLEHLVEQIVGCRASAREAIVVSSGAIVCGMAKLKLSRRPRAIAQLQACAAIGQHELMRLYGKSFSRLGMTTAQLLLTQQDLADDVRWHNAKQTLLTLLHRQVVPIVNENDTVAVEEITFGDNDRLAALLAVAVDAQLLIILSDVEGLLRGEELIERIEGLNSSHHAVVREGTRGTTRGGMASKLEAARIVGHDGIPMVIANGGRRDVLTELLAGKPIGTLFVPPRNRLTPRKWRIAFSLRQAQGTLTVDDGAAEALLERGKSLLASGLCGIRGRFDAGAYVAVEDTRGQQLARGVSNYSASDLQRIRGLKSADAAKVLGEATMREVVHRDHLVLSREVS